MTTTVNVKMDKWQFTQYMEFVAESSGCKEDDPYYLSLVRLYEKHFNKPDYELSANQKKFVRKAMREGMEIRYDYSGRGMYGEKCPAVVAPNGAFSYKGCRVDNMGRDMVYYVPY